MSADACIFCRIIEGRIPATFAHRDDQLVAIEDVNPQAPSHVLVMPVVHSPNLEDFVASNPPELVANLFALAAQLGKRRGADGFRVVVNTGARGGQTVDHLHVHVLAGRDMRWPPG